MFEYLKKTRNPVVFDASNPGFLEIMKKSLWNWFVWLILLNMVFFTTIIRITGIYSSSMTPTLQTNEIVVSAPLSYGFTPINFSLSFKDINILSIKPKMGDIIAFYDKYNYDMVFSKRIIGCPGDTIKVSNGILIINGKPVTFEYKGYYVYMENDKVVKGDIYRETMPNNIAHDVLQLTSLGYGSNDFTQEFVVPEGHYFAMGDNRGNSLDSRCELGFIKEKHIIGKVYITVFSNGNQLSLNLWKLVSAIRPHRSLQWLI